MMFKETSFLPILLGATLVSAVPTQIVKRTTPVIANYEDITFSGIPFVTSNKPLPLYQQLSYTGFLAIREVPLEDPLIHPNGFQSVVSQNFSSISAQYTGSPVSAFIPASAYFGCYLSTSSAVAPSLSCTVQVTAYQPDGTQYPIQANCNYGGIGTLQQCTFPNSWTNVGKLQFNIITSTILSTVGNSLGNLLGNLGASIGTISIFVDDFTSTYKCISGQVNSEATGQCISAVTPRSNTELVARTSGEVLNDYESIPIGGISQLISSVPLTFYNQLTYGGTWRAIMKTGASALLQQIYGQQAAVGFNGSTITSVYLASPVASFKANYASFACYISTTTGVSPGVACTVQVTAFKTDGSTYEDVAGCGYNGLGLVKQCTFPSTWTNVAKLSFQIVASEILQEVGPSLGGLLGGLIGTVGSIGFIVDDFDANYNCVAGKTNSVVAPGLCG
ncbi:hypothetical protein BHYA_0062g00280 [Botrytis hyacinthi]|uniref:Peptidase A1 domain-containing protein n=1 Tax=Botrytis hyacinthi TaxID=278943 RepID=A0A4Z1GQH6_9HELO|nr:hypothetical protein BHYA_0062g00280 [Botrytis hyacinthi]